MDRTSVVNNLDRESADRILIVDDDQDVLFAMRDMFEMDERYIVETAADSDAAVRAIGEFAPDMAILDVKLGKHLGTDLISEIKQISPDTICMMMTGFRDVGYAVKALRVGAIDYFFKPIRPEIMMEKVAYYLHEHRQAKEQSIKNQYLKTVFQSTSQHILLLDRSGRVLESTQAVHDSTQRFSKNIQNVVFWDIPLWSYSNKLRGKIRNLFMMALEGAEQQLEIECHDAPGVKIVRDFRVSPVFNEEGEIQAVLAEGHDVTSRKSTEEQLVRLAHYDALTGLPNRNYFESYMQRTIANASRYQRTFSLIFIDIDDFKKINDQYSHQAGDDVLVQVSEKLGECVREGDLACRYAGDEFIVVLNDVAKNSYTSNVAERIVNSVSTIHIGTKLEDNVTVTLGLASYPGDGGTLDTLLHNADLAMYEGKYSGKNCYRAFGEQSENET